jgi:hypothetical protein
MQDQPVYIALTQEQLDQLLAKSAPHPNHEAHHAFVQLMIERDARRSELWAKFQASLVGGIALALLGGLGWVGTVILDYLRHHN